VKGSEVKGSERREENQLDATKRFFSLTVFLSTLI